MFYFTAQMVTADEVNQGFSNGLASIFQGVWNILGPFAGAAVVLFLIIVGVGKIVGSKTRR